MSYYSIALSDQEIESGAYKEHLGGGADRWEERGRAQLDFLVRMGMTPASRLLDVGCGPLRCGVHCIAYLDAGNYFGMDYNRSFVKAAHHVVSHQGLATKAPTIERIDDFDVSGVFTGMDIGIAFSVLNHCSEAQRAAFFANVGKAFAPAGSLYVTHAWWFDPSYLSGSNMRVAGTIVHGDVDCFDGGWDLQKPGGRIFPILQLRFG